MSTFSEPIGSFESGVNCDFIRTTRAFMIMGLIFAGFSFLLSWLAYNAIADDILYRIPAILFGLLSCHDTHTTTVIARDHMSC